MHCGALGIGAQFAQAVSLPLQQIANGCNFGVLRRQKRPYLEVRPLLGATSNHAARLGRRCAATTME
jgi:hypothetical protein